MKRNNNILKISVTIAITAIIVFTAAFISGRGIPGKIFGKGSDGEKQNQTTEQIGAENTNLQQNTVDNTKDKPVKTPTKKEIYKDIKVKAVYLSGNSAGLKDRMNKIIELSKKSELNAVVIDIKEDGKVRYKSEVPEVLKNGALEVNYEPESLIKTLHENNIYVIGRIVCFRDNLLATKRADLAIKKPGGQIWKENGTTAWTNPYNEDVWTYNLDIAKEAIKKGFDEIQFDYVRFPTGAKSEFEYSTNPVPKEDAISNFLTRAEKEISQDLGVSLSADVFGIIAESELDGKSIGQLIEKVGKDIDFLSPMIYPSHYANASKGVMGNGVGQTLNNVKFTAPDLDPYNVVYNALITTKNKTSKVEGYNAKIRPYIQAFTATYLPKGYYQTYGPEQVKQQIKAIYDAGYDQWILWDPANNYQEAYFEKKTQ